MLQSDSSLEDLVRRCTVRVVTSTESGTGFFIAPGLIVTCAHVIEGINQRQKPVEISWGTQAYTAHIWRATAPSQSDLALLRVDILGHPCAYLQGSMEIREPLYAYGYPDDYPTGDSATIEYEGPTSDGELLKLKAGQFRPGFSGAPLLNQRTGCVCGIVQTTRDRSTDLGGRAVPIDIILREFPEVSRLHYEFHQQDRTWLARLTPQQLQTRFGNLANSLTSLIQRRMQLEDWKGLHEEYQSISLKLVIIRAAMSDEDSSVLLRDLVNHWSIECSSLILSFCELAGLRDGIVKREFLTDQNARRLEALQALTLAIDEIVNQSYTVQLLEGRRKELGIALTGLERVGNELLKFLDRRMQRTIRELDGDLEQARASFTAAGMLPA